MVRNITAARHSLVAATEDMAQSFEEAINQLRNDVITLRGELTLLRAQVANLEEFREFSEIVRPGVFAEYQNWVRAKERLTSGANSGGEGQGQA